MKFTKEGISELKKLGVDTSMFSDSTEHGRPTALKKEENVIKKAPANFIKERKNNFTVLRTGTKFKDILNGSFEFLLYEGDTFSIIGEDFKYFQGCLFRKAKVIKSCFEYFEGKMGWIEISGTDAPKELVKRNDLLGQFVIKSENLPIRDCDNLNLIGTLSAGDSVDFDEFNDVITLKEFVVRKVFIRNSNNKDLINKKVWMPIMYINKNKSVGIYNTEFTINKETVLDVNFDGEEIYWLHNEDTFIFTNDCIQYIEGVFYKEVKIISSKNGELVGKKGWIELSNSNALLPTIHLVSNNNGKAKLVNETEKRNIICKDYILPRDILGYKPNCTFANNENITVLDKGQLVTIFREVDSNGRVLIQCKQEKSDGSTHLVDYAVQRSVFAS